MPLKGAGDASMEFEQATPSVLWVVVHGLNKKPSVVVVDSGGSIIQVDVEYVDYNSLKIHMNAATSGIAVLN